MGYFVFTLLFLGNVILPETWTSSHSLRYFHTTMTRPGLREPQYLAVGYVDDQQFLSFDSGSESQRVEPRVAWMERMELEVPGYWERETWIHRGNAQIERLDLETLRSYFNQSAGGVHTIQYMTGCEVTPELGFRRGFFQDAYDGRDYLALDTETYTWTAAVPHAENTKRKWEAERGYTEGIKEYLEEECVKWLQKYLEMGREMLQRADPPSSRVTHHTTPNGEVTLRCRAQDFYPADISLTWLRDGQEQLQDTEFTETRPAGDGTFQKWAAVAVTPGQEGEYTCRVQHQGLPEPLTLQWEPQSSPTCFMAGLLVGLLLIIIIKVIAGIRVWRRNSDNDSAQGSGVFLTARA